MGVIWHIAKGEIMEDTIMSKTKYTPPTPGELWNDIEQAGLTGPWSWSDQVDLIASMLARRVIMSDSESEPDESIDGLLKMVRRRVIYIATGEDKAKGSEWRDPAKELPPPIGNGVVSEDVLVLFKTDGFYLQKVMYCRHQNESGFHWPVLAWRYLPDGPEWLSDNHSA